MVDNLNALRQIEGFPIGDDEDILALSDPPHYTAYPNPHIAEFIAQHGKPYDETTDTYHCEPFASDISEGRNGHVYNAHSYHTKVPYKAIVPFIEHYTKPGDIVLDGFCGTGMTGVAAQISGRRAILCDLSPIATFIAYNYNTSVSVEDFEREAKRILSEVENECGWMYNTRHHDGRIGKINFVVWSDILLCPYCQDEIIFWDAAVDVGAGLIHESFLCPRCQAQVIKRDAERATEIVSDQALNKEMRRPRQVPVRINYSIGKARFEKVPDRSDIELLNRIQRSQIPYWYPTTEMMFKGKEWGDTWRAGYHSGITHTHHFYLGRSLWVLAALRERAKSLNRRIGARCLFLFSSYDLTHSTRMTRFIFKAGGDKLVLTGNQSGTLYVPSAPVEKNIITGIRGMKLPVMKAALSEAPCQGNLAIVSTQSATDLSNVLPNSVDYIFTDPPFGDNLMYSELNFLWEAWFKVFTNNRAEAIISDSQKKALDEYRRLMSNAFVEMYRVLKPGHWITVVFHNSRASVWNAIQEALARAGFLVAQVTIMDKQQGTIKQITAPGAVKNDLVINAYKPRESIERQLSDSIGVGQERTFIKHHLDMLPLTPNIERTREMLYSKLLAYYVQHGYQIQYNADQFYRLLDREFPEADGYYFRDEAQRGEYEARKLKLKQKELAQAPIFVLDERSALQWLWHFLDRPRTYSDIYTAYVKALQAREDEIPELRTLLDENFVRSNGDYRRPDVATKQELEQKRQARLLREFDDYLLQARAGRKLKDVRKEAVIAGFTQAYREQRFADILTVGRKLDKKLVEASTEIFDFMDIAEAKVEK